MHLYRVYRSGAHWIGAAINKTLSSVVIPCSYLQDTKWTILRGYKHLTHLNMNEVTYAMEEMTTGDRIYAIERIG